MKPDKPVEADNQPTPTPTNQARGAVSHEQIAQRAEKLWRERSCPAGNDQAIWLEAESQLKAELESRPVSGTESRPYADESAQPTRARTKVQDPAESAVQTRSATERKAKHQSGKSGGNKGSGPHRLRNQ
jgi:hypothetical protein